MRDLYDPEAVVAATVCEFKSYLAVGGEGGSFGSLWMRRGFECRPMGDDGWFQLRCHVAWPGSERETYRAAMRTWYERLLVFVPAEYAENCRAVLNLNYPKEVA